MPQQPSVVEHISPRMKQVGGITVARVLPVRSRRLIGAWCFLDHAGPALLHHRDEGMHVAPHPHIGLQTFTWMLEGELLHRDSLGSRQLIRPGQVNLMTAGRGIAHTEDSAGEQPALHAAQLWIALPEAHRHMAPRFDHYPQLPVWQQDGAGLTLLVGEYGEHRAPTLHFSPLIGMDIQAAQSVNTHLTLRPDFEYGVMVLTGSAEVNGEAVAQNQLIYLGSGLTTMALSLAAGARLLVLGGEPLNEPVLMWWNFVARTRAEVQQAISDWHAASPRFGTVADDPRPPTPSPLMP